VRESTYTYGVLAFLACCLAFWLARERLRATRASRLIAATRRIAAGDGDTSTGLRGPDDLGVLGDAIDQTAARLRSVTATLRARQEWFRMLLEHGSDVILALDAGFRIGFAGPSLPRVLGWTTAQVARRPLEDFIHPDDMDAVRASLETVLKRSGFGEPIAFRFRHADGGWRSVEAIGNHPDDWAGPEQIILTGRDITARERLEGQLRQAQKMEALGRFAGGVAHDFNNLLTAIQGYTSLIMMDLAPHDPHREDLEEIRKASERAAALTRQILAFSRRHVVEPMTIDLNQTIMDLERLVPRLIGEDVAVVIALDPALAPVRADPRQLEQVILNLVVNARDAMPDGGRLTLETASDLISDSDPRASPDLPPGPYAVLTVSDTGTGMDPAIVPNIFDPFFTTKEPGRGTGLGLATVYGIVKQAGGHVEVETAPGEGASFRLYFPAAAGEGATAVLTVAGGPGPRGSETVLLVEDEESVRVFASKALEKQGYRVLQARHGRDALLRLSQHDGPVHLVITDIVMPEMGGSELARRLAGEHPELPVLFMSGYTDDEVAQRGLGAEQGFLQKPFTSDGLARKVREVLGGRLGG
jgi:PAS domain S-box-containing protein